MLYTCQKSAYLPSYCISVAFQLAAFACSDICCPVKNSASLAVCLPISRTLQGLPSSALSVTKGLGSFTVTTYLRVDPTRQMASALPVRLLDSYLYPIYRSVLTTLFKGSLTLAIPSFPLPVLAMDTKLRIRLSFLQPTRSLLLALLSGRDILVN